MWQSFIDKSCWVNHRWADWWQSADPAGWMITG